MGEADEAEVVVVGAGPAGLTAALYLGRYHRSVRVLHDGTSRALRIPLTHNAPGFPGGVAGADLLARMRKHAEAYSVRVEEARVDGARRTDGGFQLSAGGRRWESRALVLATGVTLHQVDLPMETHEAAIRAGVLRYCPICDGYEATGRAVGVIGCDSNGAAEALFLRQFTANITLLPLSHAELSAAHERQLHAAGVTVVQGALAELRPGDEQMTVFLEDRQEALSFDVVYPALGRTPRSELAAQLGMTLSKEGCAPYEAPRGTDVPGLFVCGDVVEGLDQISVAMGHGAQAATSAHNWLREQDHEALREAAGPPPPTA